MTSPARILIIDDDPIIRMLASSALSDVGHTVTEAESAEAAIDVLAESRPDLLVLDLVMPGMGGLAFCAWLRGRPESSRLPVLVMTALDGDDTIRQAFDAGASDFIPKPFNPGILAHRVRFLLRARDTVRALEASRRNLHEAQDIARLGSWELNRVSGEAICSDGLFKVLDRDPVSTPTTLDTYMDGVHPDDVDRVRHAITQAIEQHSALDVIHRFMTRDAQIRWIQLRVKFEYNASGHAVRSYGTVQDITAQRRIEERLDYLTRHDPVTGLANRRRFIELLQQRIDQHRPGTFSAVLHIGLEGYQRVNNSLGHEAGDALLINLAQRLTHALADGAAPPEEAEHTTGTTLARWSGAEFIALVGDLPSPIEARRVAQRLLDSIRHPVRTGSNELILDARIGIAIHPGDADGASSLINACVAATHHANGRGPGGLQFYSAQIDADARQRVQLEHELRHALADGDADSGLLLHYQPKYDRNGEIRSAEALVRWQHPTLGLLAPDRFIPLAEESGLIIALGEWVVRRTCAQMRAWRDAGLPALRVAINLAASHFLDDGLLPLLVGETQRYGIPPEQIELELTESMVMQDTARVRAMLGSMHAHGFQLAIDDFGVGYSSLSLLSFLPVDTLKIDRSFVEDMLNVPRQASIVRAIIALARGLGLEVVAEGVETAEQADALHREGCDLIQGYHFARPMPADEFARRLGG